MRLSHPRQNKSSFFFPFLRVGVLPDLRKRCRDLHPHEHASRAQDKNDVTANFSPALAFPEHPCRCPDSNLLLRSAASAGLQVHNNAETPV
jgi:hypothetical protein